MLISRYLLITLTYNLSNKYYIDFVREMRLLRNKATIKYIFDMAIFMWIRGRIWSYDVILKTKLLNKLGLMTYLNKTIL